jgi:hypothetical protein
MQLCTDTVYTGEIMSNKNVAGAKSTNVRACRSAVAPATPMLAQQHSLLVTMLTCQLVPQEGC